MVFRPLPKENALCAFFLGKVGPLFLARLKIAPTAQHYPSQKVAKGVASFVKAQIFGLLVKPSVGGFYE